MTKQATRITRATPAGQAYLDLQNRARREKRGTQEYLTAYVVERWLARLSRSAYAEDFVLKGGVLLAAIGQRRPTADADTLALRLENDTAAVAARVAEIAALPDPDDGVEFLPETADARVIRDQALYHGIRATMTAKLATATVKLSLDINFGDPVTPAPQRIELPGLRPGAEPVRMLGYPVATVLAEKTSTALELGEANTRVRDYADLYTITTSRNVDYQEMRDALEATATFRAVTIVPLSSVIGDLIALRSAAYRAYVSGLEAFGAHLPSTFDLVVEHAITFADPLAREVGRTTWIASKGAWE